MKFKDLLNKRLLLVSKLMSLYDQCIDEEDLEKKEILKKSIEMINRQINVIDETPID